MDPVHLFLSKCHCYLHLPQADRQDERHVRMMAMILPKYFALLINDAEAARFADRDLLKEIKLLKRIASTGICRRVMKTLEIECGSLIPWSRLAGSSSALLAKYARSQSGMA